MMMTFLIKSKKKTAKAKFSKNCTFNWMEPSLAWRRLSLRERDCEFVEKKGGEKSKIERERDCTRKRGRESKIERERERENCDSSQAAIISKAFFERESERAKEQKKLKRWKEYFLKKILKTNKQDFYFWTSSLKKSLDNVMTVRRHRVVVVVISWWQMDK